MIIIIRKGFITLSEMVGWLVGWLILMTCQPVLHYFMPGDYGNVFILCIYSHFCVIVF